MDIVMLLNSAVMLCPSAQKKKPIKAQSDVILVGFYLGKIF